jgi:ethanolamine utilization EutJ-like protein
VTIGRNYDRLTVLQDIPAPDAFVLMPGDRVELPQWGLTVSCEEAEEMKMNSDNHKMIFPIVKPVIDKMASIVQRNIDTKETEVLYLCGGTCCLTGIEKVFEKQVGIPTIKPNDPFLVTPTGIAMNCVEGDLG